MPGRSLPNGVRFGVGLSGILRPGRRRIRNLLGPSEAELRANLAGEASADAALAMQEAEALEAAALDAPALETSTLDTPTLDIPAAEDVAAPATPLDDLEAAPARAETEPPAVAAEPPVPRDLTAAAFFDVDNTMVQGASIIHFARGLAARKYLRTADLVDFAWKQVKFRVTGKENSGDVAQGRERALSFVAGRSTAELAQLGEEIYDEVIADKIWAGTRALAQMHIDAGQQVWLVTATPVELAQVIAKRLGLTGALGTVAESHDGVFTGRLVGDILHGLGKAHAVRTLAIREGLNLKRCTAYSDSYNDVPMLSLVGTAVAVNPDADLRELARNRGWEVRDFRTGRKAAKIGVPTALLLGAVGGAIGAILSRRRERALLAELAAERSRRRQPMKTLRRCASSR